MIGEELSKADILLYKVSLKDWDKCTVKNLDFCQHSLWKVPMMSWCKSFTKMKQFYVVIMASNGRKVLLQNEKKSY